MIIYNVTVKVDHPVATGWLNWLADEHIPAMIATGCFTHAIILRLLETDESDGITYVIQYFSGSKALYNLYIEKFSDEMRNAGRDKWGDAFVAFRSVMQVVN